ncbi:BTAD domain-containing putative transcriptional regulator [Nonomuraea dietziae]|uniref:BTAD domain-containing putative transcriptional regulator n=1 Tax=Nonomuraea dietziae TaxID=65515 RepID=UPI003CD0B0E8
MLDPSLFALDATEFADLLETARQEHASGQISVAAKRLTQALGLWTGTALAGVPGEGRRTRAVPAGTTEADRHPGVAAAPPGTGRAHRGGGRGPAHHRAEPIRRAVVRDLSLALYRSGRRAEALELYRTVYDLLSKELGVSPGPAATGDARQDPPGRSGPRRRVRSRPMGRATRRTALHRCPLRQCGHAAGADFGRSVRRQGRGARRLPGPAEKEPWRTSGSSLRPRTRWHRQVDAAA